MAAPTKPPPPAPAWWRSALGPALLATFGYLLSAVHANALVAPYRVTRAYTRPHPVRLSAFSGAFAVNTLLRDGAQLLAGERGSPLSRAETIAVQPGTRVPHAFGGDGWLYALDVRSGAAAKVMHVGGCVHGAVFDGPASIVAADCAKGVVRVVLPSHSAPRGALSVLATASDDGEPLMFTDGLDVAPDGTVYFTDASDMAPYRTHAGGWAMERVSQVDFFRGAGRGRLLALSPNGSVTTLARGLLFANGVAVAHDGRSVLVSETFGQRVMRYRLDGPRAGTLTVFADLPTIPDGVSRAADGGYYVAGFTVVEGPMAFAADYPWLRLVLGSLPAYMWPAPPHYGLVLKLTSTGAPEYAMHDPGGHRVRAVTAVTEVRDSDEDDGGVSADGGGWLYLGQLAGAGVSRVRIPAAPK